MGNENRALTTQRVKLAVPVLLGTVCVYVAYRLANFAPWGGDFRGFWAASFLALHGHAADAYVPAIHRQAQMHVNGATTWAAFFYPPTFLLLCVPLALLPFTASALTFIAGSAVLFVISVRTAIPRTMIAVCAVLMCAFIYDDLLPAQNGVLMAAIMTFGVRNLDARPVLAGACLGLLATKPQLGIVLPFALAASGRWRVFAATGAMAMGLVGASVLAFGPEAWVAFFAVLPKIGVWLGYERPGLMLSVFGALRTLGVPSAVGYAAQAIVTVACCIVIAMIGRRARDAEALGAAICVAAPLASPWLHDYDLAILAFPLIWLLRSMNESAAKLWEMIVVFLVALFPILAPHSLMLWWDVTQGATPLLAALLVVLWRRVSSEAERATGDH